MIGRYDIIGDVHGHADILETLLEKLGYEKTKQGRDAFYRHPERTAVFVGDIIDRGKENFKAMAIVKAMVDNGSALVIMGNHEYNALCYHTMDSNGYFLRPHKQKNFLQHKEVLEEIQKNGQQQWNIYLGWIRKMPLFLELDGFRVVHACWNQQCVDFIKNNTIRDNNGRLTDQFLNQSSQKGTTEFHVIDILLKGEEIRLPADHPGIYDKDGNLRKKLRVKWWMTPEERASAQTYDQAVRADETAWGKIKGIHIPGDVLKDLRSPDKMDNTNNIPVFFGHYWFSGEPRPLTPTAACLDYSVGKGGPLVCYRWDGEKQLIPSNFRELAASICK
jgi:hypothetical protein